MTNQKNKDGNDPWGSSWNIYRAAKCQPQARKLHRIMLYTFPAMDRLALRILRGRRNSKTNDQKFKHESIKIYSKPWWMGFQQFQAMLTRLGVPY